MTTIPALSLNDETREQACDWCAEHVYPYNVSHEAAEALFALTDADILRMLNLFYPGGATDFLAECAHNAAFEATVLR